MFTNARSYFLTYLLESQMLGLVVNSFIEAIDEEDFHVHRAKASTMDLEDMSLPRTDINMPVDEGMPAMETDDDEPAPSYNVEAILRSLDVTPLRILAPSGNPSDVQGLRVDTRGRRRGQPKMSSPRERLERRHSALPGDARHPCRPGRSWFPRWRTSTFWTNGPDRRWTSTATRGGG
jgi:hypothetical protein